MKVLFIGNSYTSCNDLPGMIRDLSEARGRTIETARVTSGGKSLEWHCQNDRTLETIDAGGWASVVLQDQSLMGVEHPQQLLSAAGTLNDRIRRAGAAPVLYLTWARQHIPEMQKDITRTYLQAAKNIEAKVAPVGIAWQKAITAAPELSLYEEDESHPNILGSYLAACVFYATLFDETPTALPNEIRLCDGARIVVDPDKAQLIQEMAKESLRR